MAPAIYFSLAVRMFIAAALDNNGIPFAIKRTNDKKLNLELREAMEDVRLRRNLHGPYKTVDDAMQALMAD